MEFEFTTSVWIEPYVLDSIINRIVKHQRKIDDYNNIDLDFASKVIETELGGCEDDVWHNFSKYSHKLKRYVYSEVVKQLSNP